MKCLLDLVSQLVGAELAFNSDLHWGPNTSTILIRFAFRGKGLFLDDNKLLILMTVNGVSKIARKDKKTNIRTLNKCTRTSYKSRQ